MASTALVLLTAWTDVCMSPSSELALYVNGSKAMARPRWHVILASPALESPRM